jgi:hypothetical protein
MLSDVLLQFWMNMSMENGLPSQLTIYYQKPMYIEGSYVERFAFI